MTNRPFVGTQPSIKCSYADCQQRFDTRKEMRRHKHAAPEHDYCKKCDVDCADWEAFTQHKVDAMQPWLEGRMKGKEEQPKHITCEFCGMDFKSFGGRRLHRDQEHRSDQHIECPGCMAVFVKAALLISHFERSECDSISRREFESEVQSKHVKAQYGDLGELNDNLRVNEAFASEPETPGLISDRSTTQDGEGGGVSLLDREDEGQSGGHAPLQAEVNLMDQQVPLTRSNFETWPRLPGQQASVLSDTMSNMSLQSPAPSISGSEFGWPTASHCGGPAYTESYPGLQSPSIPQSEADFSDTASQATTTATNLGAWGTAANTTQAWGTSSTSRALFPNARPTPAQLELEPTDNSTNLLHVRFWDPQSPHYDVARFLNTVINLYCCPFPGCGSQFETPGEMADHLHVSHIKTSYRCPGCLKIFKSAASLVNHAESTTKCRVRETKVWPRLLDEVSGGFLKAEAVSVPKIFAREQALVREGERPPNGIMDTRFEAQIPQGSQIQW